MLKTLLHIIQEVSAAPDLAAALRIVVQSTKKAMQTDAVSIFLTDYEQGENILMATEGLNQALVGKIKLDFNQGLVGLVAQREQPINLDDAHTHPDFLYMPEIGEEKYHAFLGVPIIHQRQLLGVLVAQQIEPRRFDEDDEAFLVTLSAQLAGAIAHAQATGILTEFKQGLHQDTVLFGLPGAPGIAMGKTVVVYPLADLTAVPDRVPDDIKTEIATFRKALKAVQKEIKQLGKNIGKKIAAEERVLFDAYLKILASKTFSKEINALIRGGNWAQGALRQVIERHIQHFEGVEDSYLQERAADLRDLGQRILFKLQAQERKRPHYPSRTILVGEEVMPAMLAEVPSERLVAVVSAQGSSHSHVAVLARALGIPAVMGVSSLPVAQLETKEIVVDGYVGEVYLSPSRSMRREVASLMREQKQLDATLEMLRDLPAETSDGHHIELFINTGLIADIERSLHAGAEGVGLYRTEIPFMMRDRFPSEEEQRIIYRKLLQIFAPRPVMMRTLDVGGDKALPYFPIVEDNPFLGWRGIRITLDHPEIFMVQLRAMLRASIGLNNLQIMLPMITSVSEVLDAKVLLNQACEDLRNEGLSVAMPSLGVMIEVPSAVYQTEIIAQHVDFLSVGSNDLTQYLLAIDRNNSRVANLYDSLHPAVLQALQMVIQGGHKAGKHVSICGEMAGDPASVLLMLAMGFDSLSMSSRRLLRVKSVIRSFSLAECQALLAEVMTMADPRSIRSRMELALEGVGLGELIHRRKKSI